MPNVLQQAGALSEPTNFAPLHTNRIFTGLWTNRNLLRDAASSDYQEHIGMSRQDSILGGFNSEISSKLTLRRRPGSSLYGAGTSMPPVKRFYSFNTFTLTDEIIRVMADTAAAVYDVTGGTPTVIFTKSAGAGSTYFLGVGNTLYMTNGVDNVQWVYDPTTGTGTIYPWGIAAPILPPGVYQAARPSLLFSWEASTGYCTAGLPGYIIPIVDSNGNIQKWNGALAYNYLTGGPTHPVWQTAGITVDGAVHWEFVGPSAWQANHSYAQGGLVTGTATVNGVPTLTMFINTSTQPGNSGATQPSPWFGALGAMTLDGANIWKSIGPALTWDSFGPNCSMNGADTIQDPNNNGEQVMAPGRTGSTIPTFPGATSATITDGTVTWVNTGAHVSSATGAWIYGYAYKASATADISSMSPASIPIVLQSGNQIIVQGYGTGAAGVDTVVLYRTAQGGSTFFYLDEIPNPGANKIWSYTDSKPDSDLTIEIQAQVGGEGTPLPAGASCLGYHLTRIFAAVGNVVWVSSGPDATVGGSSGNAGFDIQLVAQSKIIRFWACSLGMVVFTVRDAYIILGSATDADPLYMVVFIEQMPLRNYDCFTVNKTTPFLLTGNSQLLSLDPSAGILEAGFPIADRLIEEYDTSASYVTFHTQSSLDSGTYVANGGMAPDAAGGKAPATGQWYRMAANNAPEQGSAWSTKAQLAGLNMGCVQSVEVTPGVFRLLISGTTAGPIWQRDQTKNTDNGNKYAVQTVFGNIVLALPGQLAALFFITLESVKTGTRAGLALLLGEISGVFETLNRTRQDPPILPPSNTLFSDRYHFAQNQSEAWCRHFQMQITWPAEDAANELLTFTIFGQTWQEMRSQ